QVQLKPSKLELPQLPIMIQNCQSKACGEPSRTIINNQLAILCSPKGILEHHVNAFVLIELSLL
ncbi:hypothetical protein D4R75_05055, partial [bacterium]